LPVEKIPRPIDLRSLSARTTLLGLLGQIPPEKVKEKVSSPTRSNSLLVPLYHTPHHQYNPCRGSSIGRACGSYNSKEINLKVVGSSPTFGYSYIKAHQSSCSFAFCSYPVSGLVLPRTAKVHGSRVWLWYRSVALCWNTELLGMISFSSTVVPRSTAPRIYTTIRNFNLSSLTILSFCASSSSTSHLQLMNRPDAHGLGSFENQTHTAPQSVISSLSTTHRLLASLPFRHNI
jgi:hypothetical protein